jgi:effector-binding domain-containing protein
MEIKEVPAMRVLSAARRLSIRQIGAVAAELTVRMKADADRCGLKANGPWTFIARNLPTDGKTAFDMRFCLPIADGAPVVAPEFELIELEDIVVASAVYQGPLRSLFTKGYAPLLDDIRHSHHAFSGESREIYHSWRNGGSGYQRIEIQFGLAR